MGRRQEGGWEGGSAEAAARKEGREARGHVPERGWAGAPGFASLGLPLEEGIAGIHGDPAALGSPSPQIPFLCVWKSSFEPL